MNKHGKIISRVRAREAEKWDRRVREIWIRGTTPVPWGPWDYAITLLLVAMALGAILAVVLLA